MNPTSRFARLIAIALLLFGFSACQKDAGSSGAETTEDAVEESQPDKDFATDGFSIGKIKIVAAANIYSNPDATKPDELQKLIETKLKEQASYDEDAGPLSGSLTYDARTSTAPGGKKSRDVVLFGDLRRKGDDDPTAKYTAEIMVRSQPGSDETYADLTADAVQQFAERVDAQIRIRGASAEALTNILESDTESQKAKVSAIQQIRERQIEGTEPVLRKLLDGDDGSIKVAASAALVRLGDSESRPKILEIAQNFSRDKDPNFLPMLYILGDMGGQEVVTYLTTVSEAHSSPAVRQVAKEAVDKAIKSTVTKKVE